jgi:hypothetical protein
MIETLYRTKTPKPSCATEQYFELSLGEQTVDGQLGYFVRETHCWWDTVAQNTVRVQYTLSPRVGFATLEEAHERYRVQRMERARRGFVHSYIPRFDAGEPWKFEAGRQCKYALIEVTRATPAEVAEFGAGQTDPQQT